MATTEAPFRLCSSRPGPSQISQGSQGLRRTQALARLSRHQWTARHNPQPRLVRHMYGLENVLLCHVRERDNTIPKWDLDNFGKVETNTLNGLPIFHYRSIPKIERAIPALGIVEIREPWRVELKALTESILMPSLSESGRQEDWDMRLLGERHPYPINRPVTMALSRWRGQDAVITGPSSRGRSREVTAASTSARSQTRTSTFFWNENWSHDHESQVFSLLGQILQLSDVDDIKKWLACAVDKEKAMIISLLEGVFESRLKSPSQPQECREATPTTAYDSGDTDILSLDSAPRPSTSVRQQYCQHLTRPRTMSSRIRPVSRSISMVSSRNINEGEGQALTSERRVTLHYKKSSGRPSTCASSCCDQYSEGRGPDANPVLLDCTRNPQLQLPDFVDDFQD